MLYFPDLLVKSGVCIFKNYQISLKYLKENPYETLYWLSPDTVLRGLFIQE